jgi:hypothetical protein
VTVDLQLDGAADEAAKAGSNARKIFEEKLRRGEFGCGCCCCGCCTTVHGKYGKHMKVACDVGCCVRAALAVWLTCYWMSVFCAICRILQISRSSSG